MDAFDEVPRRCRIVPAWFWFAVLAVLGFGTAWLTSAESWPVTFPLALQGGAFCSFLAVLWRRKRGVVPWFEIGVVYAAVLTLYATYPLVRFLLVGDRLGPAQDLRWGTLNPTVGDVAHIAWLYACHLVAFLAVYLVVRGRLVDTQPRPSAPGKAAFIAVVTLYLGIAGFWFFLGLFYDLSAGNYLESYLIQGRLPLFLAQLFNHLNGAKYPLSLVILLGLVVRYRASRPLIIGWIVVLVALTVTRQGSRTELVLVVMAATMMYHTLIRPLSPSALVTGAGLGIVLFLAYGMLRSGVFGDDGSQVLNPLLHPSELDVLFTNALEVHLAQSSNSLGPVPFALYVVDLVMLLPQQIAPFQKVDPANWLVTTFWPDYAATGGAFAFGTMVEAVLTGGWLSAAARGAALGFCFAKIHRFYVKNGHQYWVFVFYVWATTLSYQCFRGTTFVLLVMFVFRFLPVLIGVRLLVTILAGARRETQRRFPQQIQSASS